jgi:hypothetical protein
MARRSISHTHLREEAGEPLENGGDIVEHLYLLGIGTRASLLAQPRRLVSVFLSVMHDEPAYLRACGAHLPPASCQCAMEVIEDTLSFDKFASLVARFGGDIRRVLPAERGDPAVEQSCGIAGLSTSRTTNVTQRVNAPQ